MKTINEMFRCVEDFVDEFESEDENLLVWYIPELDEIKLGGIAPLNWIYSNAIILGKLV